MRRGEDIVGGVQAQHWHLHRLEPVARTGIVVVVVVGGVAEHDGGEPLVKFTDGLCLAGGERNAIKRGGLVSLNCRSRGFHMKWSPTFIMWSMS